jgi:hypothetical protein
MLYSICSNAPKINQRRLVWHTYELYPRLQLGCSKKLRIAAEASLCSVVLCCRTAVIWNGRDETRTRDLRRASATKHVLVSPTASDNYAILQVFYRICRGGLSIPYASVSARLQYGCSNLPASKASFLGAPCSSLASNW